MMDDLIRRQAAITLPAMPKEYREYQTFNLDDAYEQGWDDLQKCIGLLPSAQQWIPSSERLPDKIGLYLVSVGTPYKPVRVYEYKPIKWDENDGNLWKGNDGSYCFNWFVNAWMPLPEPYNGKVEKNGQIDRRG